MPASSFAQTSFRFYEDDGSEAANTAIDAVNTNITRVISSDNNLCVRFAIDNTGISAGLATDDYQLKYSKNAGAYTDVTTSSSDVFAFNSSNLTNAGAATDRVAGSTAFSANGTVSEDGLADDCLIGVSNYVNFLYTLTLKNSDLANNDTLDFRVYKNGAVLNAYTNTPRITISKSGGGGSPSRRITGGAGLIF